MDNNTNIKDKNTPQNGLQDVQNALVLHTSPDIIVLYKKTEKLSSALYLVTQFIPEDDTLRRTLRERSVALISALASSRTSLNAPRTGDEVGDEGWRGAASEPHVLILEISSLLSVAHAAGHVSEMNKEILLKEYGLLLSMLRRNTERPQRQEHSGRELQTDFFDTSHFERALSQGHLKGHGVRGERDVSFRNSGNEPHEKCASKTQGQEHGAKEGTPSPRKERTRHHSAGALVRHSRRRESILTLISEKPDLSVKDVHRAIPHVSEKTLQRELAAMVEDGILKKRGERRWSTYSLR